MSRFEEHIEYKINDMWERMGTGEICGSPIVEIKVCFPGHITPNNNFLKDITNVFKEIEKRYIEKLSEQE